MELLRFFTGFVRSQLRVTGYYPGHDQEYCRRLNQTHYGKEVIAMEGLKGEGLAQENDNLHRHAGTPLLAKEGRLIKL